jgi:hypothetical protein
MFKIMQVLNGKKFKNKAYNLLLDKAGLYQ